jgi:cytochrome c553
MSRSILDEGCIILFEFTNHPVCAAKERDHFLMAQPPLLENGGEWAQPPFRQLFVLLLLMLILAGCTRSTSHADETRGQALYQLHCAPCHETPPPDLLKEPPKLQGLFDKKTLPSGVPATDEQVRMVIVGGLRTMPAFQGRLQEQDIRDLIAYLHKM